jgi:hypothetical protein
MNEWTRCLQNAVKQTRDTNQQQITLGEIGPSASPPPWGITLLSNGSETGKGGISTLQERGHFYLALTHSRLGASDCELQLVSNSFLILSIQSGRTTVSLLKFDKIP